MKTKKLRFSVVNMILAKGVYAAILVRTFSILFILSLFEMISIPAIAQDKNITKEIADHFSSVRTMTGEFMQFGPRGEQTGGTFYMERPGKIRFNYNNSPIRVISDGESIVVNNRKLDTWDLYPLSKTPLKLLLSDKIDFGNGRLKQSTQTDNIMTLVLGDKSLFGDSKITMIFNSKDFSLKQWTITDMQNFNTTVTLSNVREGVKFAKDMFKIDYQRIAMKRKHGSD